MAFEIFHDRGRVLEGKVGEQRRHLRCGDAQDEEGKEADQADRYRGHGRDSGSAERPQKIEQSLHLDGPTNVPTRQDLPGL